MILYVIFGLDLELSPPLLDRHIASGQHQTALVDRCSCGHSDQRFARAARQNNDPGARSTVSEHFAQALFLIWPIQRQLAKSTVHI